VCLFVASASSFAVGQQRHDGLFDSNGVPIHYVDTERGQPVVLLHGLTGTYERHWEAPGVAAKLEAAGYRVIGIDCRGHGQSGKPHAPESYGLEMVEDVVRLLDHLHIERAHVVGYSMGGAIATQLLVRHPDRLRTVTLVGSGWDGEDLHAVSSAMNQLADGFARRDATALIRGVTSGQKPLTEQDVAAANNALFARNDPEALAAAARGMPALVDVPAARLRAVTLPLLAIVGEYDARNLQGANRMRTVASGMDVITIPGATHATTPAAAAQYIVAFLDAHKGP